MDGRAKAATNVRMGRWDLWSAFHKLNDSIFLCLVFFPFVFFWFLVERRGVLLLMGTGTRGGCVGGVYVDVLCNINSRE